LRQNAKKFGAIWGALILALLLVAMLAPGLVGAQDGNILFEQKPASPEAGGGWTSDGDSAYLCMDDFQNVTGNICDIHWYGMSVQSYGNCNATGMIFEIIFYEDNGGFPGKVTETFSNVIPTFTDYGDRYIHPGGYNFTVYRFDVALERCVNLTQGWVSVQSTSSSNGCYFWWRTSFDGSSNAIQQGGYGNLSVNLAFTLTGVSQAVDGEGSPIDKASLLAPWIAVAALLFSGLGWLVIRRQRA